jgi:hypothetical protein
MIGPLVFTGIFALAIAPQRSVRLAGAPYWLASALLLGSMLIVWMVTRPAENQIATPRTAD